jgi:nitroimidazol reductase NimA-like FMN-containing flavoprotein (pyridoxamine 5'-phosphate oxidase superfamily)
VNESITEAIGHIEKSTYALLVTVGEENKPFAREIGPFVNSGLDIYFVTRLDSQKIKQFTLNPYITLYFPNMNLDPREFKSVTVTGTCVRIPAGAEFDGVLDKMDRKSPGYVKYMSKEGFEIWTIFKMAAKTLQYTNYLKSTKTVKIEI